MLTSVAVAGLGDSIDADTLKIIGSNVTYLVVWGITDSIDDGELQIPFIIIFPIVEGVGKSIDGVIKLLFSVFG